MSRMQRLRAVSIRSLILLALVVIAPGVAFAQAASVAMPENARARSYGSGWECDPGHQEVNGACVAVKVPVNAYATNASYGAGWECNRGYRAVDEACMSQ
jgi:hypothetical protein